MDTYTTKAKQGKNNSKNRLTGLDLDNDKHIQITEFLGIHVDINLCVSKLCDLQVAFNVSTFACCL